MVKCLQDYKVKNHLSYQQMGEQLGVDRTYVFYIIAGNRQPSLSLLDKLAKVTGIKLERLLKDILNGK